MSDDLRVIAYGGGVQSTALVVLATQGDLDYDYALFSNVGEQAELPATLRYVRDVIMPWTEGCAGPQVIELSRRHMRGPKKGQKRDLYDDLVNGPQRSIPIPIRMPDTGAPGTRNCTGEYKIKVVSRWLKTHGATEEQPATVAIGISTDEYHRANRRTPTAREEVVYPLLDLGLSRGDCRAIIHDAGLPVPPKSSCYFCPFHRPAHWAEMRRDEPGLFELSADLETLLNMRRDELGKDHVYLTRFGKPLRDAITEAQDTLFAEHGMDNDGSCDEGYCFI